MTEGFITFQHGKKTRDHITRNDARNDLVNGQLAKVAAIDATSVIIETDGHHMQLPTDRPLNMD